VKAVPRYRTPKSAKNYIVLKLAGVGMANKIPKRELRRLNILLQFEMEARQQGHKFIAGVDEAGRGPLAGPVVAAACMIPEGILLPGLDDSKKLTPKQREELFEAIINTKSIIYGIGIKDSLIVDTINIYQATIQAMLEAVNNLACEVDLLLVDGLQLPHPKIPVQKIIQGDSKSHSIAAASIIAKVTRDRMMCEFHKQWPQYGFDQHKGYGTEKHVEAIKIHGPCPIHRMSFEPLKCRKNEVLV
jgi:ribonuclease HII